MQTLTAKQMKLYKKLIENHKKVELFCSLEYYILTKYQENPTEDLHAVFHYSQNDF